MIDLDVSKWKEFKLIDLFNIDAGKYHYPSEYEIGCTAYVSASNMNNAIAERISLDPDFKGNKITTGKVGCTAFYQEEDFCATSDVNIFTPLFEMNRYVGLFIATVINFNENYKWGYGRQCRVGDSKEIVVKLPACADGRPDFAFMENYIKSIWGGSHYTSIPYSNVELDTNGWGEFELRNLFEIKYGINLELNTCTESDDPEAINFVSRTEQNNGVSARVLPIEGKEPQEAGLITCAGGGSVLSTFLQDRPFYSGRDLYLLKSKREISDYAKLFLITVIKANKYRYSYGRQANVTLPYLKIKLPVTNEGDPDFLFMENYIRQLQFSDML